MVSDPLPDGYPDSGNFTILDPDTCFAWTALTLEADCVKGLDDDFF